MVGSGFDLPFERCSDGGLNSESNFCDAVNDDEISPDMINFTISTTPTYSFYDLAGPPPVAASLLSTRALPPPQPEMETRPSTYQIYRPKEHQYHEHLVVIYILPVHPLRQEGSGVVVVGFEYDLIQSRFALPPPSRPRSPPRAREEGSEAPPAAVSTGVGPCLRVCRVEENHCGKESTQRVSNRRVMWGKQTANMHESAGVSHSRRRILWRP